MAVRPPVATVEETLDEGFQATLMNTIVNRFLVQPDGDFLDPLSLRRSCWILVFEDELIEYMGALGQEQLYEVRILEHRQMLLQRLSSNVVDALIQTTPANILGGEFPSGSHIVSEVEGMLQAPPGARFQCYHCNLELMDLNDGMCAFCGGWYILEIDPLGLIPNVEAPPNMAVWEHRLAIFIEVLLAAEMEFEPPQAPIPPSPELAAAIEAIPQRAVSEAEATETCCICLYDYKEPWDIALFLSCTHFFHPACIITWLRDGNGCPLCRAVLPR